MKLIYLIFIFLVFAVFLIVVIPSSPWVVSTATYTGKFFDVIGEEDTPKSIFFSPTGTTAYIIGATFKRVFEYHTDTPWNVSGLYYLDKFSPIILDDSPNGLFFNATGKKMYVIGGSADRVLSYTLGTAWDVSTATWDGSASNFSVGGQDTLPQELYINSTGNGMYVIGSGNDRIYHYRLTTPWVVNTAVWYGANSNLSISAQQTSPAGLTFNSSGTAMYISGTGGGATFGNIHQYTLSIPWNISTATWNGVGTNLSVGNEDTNPSQIVFNSTGNTMFMIGDTFNQIFEYTLITPSNCWTQSGSLLIIPSGCLYHTP